MRYTISLALILAALWLGISGVYKPPILMFAALSIALVIWLARRMQVVGVEHNPVLFSWRLPLYWAWLVWQILLANLHLARRVLAPHKISPRVIRVPLEHQPLVAKVTYANSITLTPGTVTLELGENELLIHALDEDSAEGLLSGEMADAVVWLESGRRSGDSS